MEAESSYKKGGSVSDTKPYFKLRLGGSRSGVTGKFAKDTNPSPQLDSSIFSLKQTRSLDSQSVSSRSTDSSGNPEKVRIVGRGGAGARRRNYIVEEKLSAPGPTIIEMKAMKKKSQVAQDAPVIRNMGRGGLGSRPQPRKSKPVPAIIVTESQNTRKVSSSKQFSRTPSLDPSLRSQPSPERPTSPVSTISTIHFAGESGLPPPDFFKVMKRRRQKSPMDSDEIDESLGSNEVFDLRPLRRDTASTVPWDNTPSTSQSNLSSRTDLKARRRERGFSMLFSIFQNDVIRKTGSTSSSSLPSMSVPSQITLSSIDTDPSYFFHGPASPPSTPPCSQETGSTTESSYSVGLGSSLSSFQREHSPSPIPISKKEDSQEEEGRSPPQYPPAKQRQVPRSLTLYLSPSEAEALEHSPPCSPFIQQYPPTISETRSSISTARSEKSESWSGEWNAGMVDVIKALRELR